VWSSIRTEGQEELLKPDPFPKPFGQAPQDLGQGIREKGAIDRSFAKHPGVGGKDLLEGIKEMGVDYKPQVPCLRKEENKGRARKGFDPFKGSSLGCGRGRLLNFCGGRKGKISKPQAVPDDRKVRKSHSHCTHPRLEKDCKG